MRILRPPFALRSLAMLLLASAAMPVRSQPVHGPVLTSGVPESAIVRPSAASAPAASLDEPSGGPHYAPRLPRGTPGDMADGAPPAPVIGFEDAVTRAYWTSPQLLAQRARLRSTDYRLPQARALSGPSLSFQATYGWQRDNVESALGGWAARSGWASTAAAVLNQPLFTFGANAAGERRALGEIAFERASLRSAEASALFAAIQSYVLVLRARESVGIVRDDLALLERNQSDNALRFERREVTASDLQQVETRVELARAQVKSALDDLASSAARFLAAVGAPAGVLTPPPPLPMPVSTLDDAYALAERNSPLLAAAYARERVSRAAADAARSGMLPRVDLRGTAQVGTVTPYSDDLRRTELRGEVVVSGPIFESGLRRARMQEAEAANDADWRLIDQALRDTRAEVADSWNEWLAVTASLDNLRNAADVARRAFDGAQLQEKAGFRTTLDVLNLARELLQARSAYNNATANAYLAQARLLANLGMLEQARLFLDAPVYDPDGHFDRTKDDGMVPVVVPLIRQFDGIFAGGRQNRSVRDPAASLAAPGVALPVPEVD